jgi:hypothetical protein
MVTKLIKEFWVYSFAPGYTGYDKNDPFYFFSSSPASGAGSAGLEK